MTPKVAALALWPRSRAQRAMTSIIGAFLLVAASVIPVAAEGPYGAWEAPTPVAEVNTAAHEGCPIESPNGKELFIASTRGGGFGKNDIWVAERGKKSDPFGPMVNLGAAITVLFAAQNLSKVLLPHPRENNVRPNDLNVRRLICVGALNHFFNRAHD